MYLKLGKLGATIAAAAMITGCATGLNSMQEREYRAMEAADVLIVEKDPSVGAALGILPGGGSFYARSPGIGAVALLFWPPSILLGPAGAYLARFAISSVGTRHELQPGMLAALGLLVPAFPLLSILTVPLFHAIIY